MSQVIVDDEGWKAIMGDERLAAARRNLSFHEIRLIVDLARKRERAALVAIRETLAEFAGEPCLSGHAFNIADITICPANPPPSDGEAGSAQSKGGVA